MRGNQADLDPASGRDEPAAGRLSAHVVEHAREGVVLGKRAGARLSLSLGIGIRSGQSALVNFGNAVSPGILASLGKHAVANTRPNLVRIQRVGRKRRRARRRARTLV